MYAEIDCPATVTSYVVLSDVPVILIVPCLFALNVGSAVLAAVTVLFAIIDFYCIVRMS